MTEPTVQHLRDELAGRARSAGVPPFRLDEILAGAERVERARGRWTVAVAAAVVAVMVTAGVLVAHQVDHRKAPPPTDRPTGDGVIRKLDDLPVGKSTTIPHLSGRTVYVGDRYFNLPEVPATMQTAGGEVVAQYPDGAIDRLDTTTARITRITEHSAVNAVLTRDGWLLYTDKVADGPATMVARDPRTGEERRAQFPVGGSCCDNPFKIGGADQFHQAVAGDQTGTYLWTFATDGLHDVPQPVVRLRGLRGRQLVSVTNSEIVLEGNNGYDVGKVGDNGSFTVTEHFNGPGQADFSLGDHIIYTDGAGRLHARERASLFEFPGQGHALPKKNPRDVALRLPVMAGFPALYGEDQNHVILEVPATDSGADQDAQVRCDLRSGGCEIAEWYPTTGHSLDKPGPAVLAGAGATQDDVRRATDFARFAVVPVAATAARLRMKPTVYLGIGGNLREVDGRDLADPAQWEFETNGTMVFGRDGPLSFLTPISDYLDKAGENSRLVARMGSHPPCVGPDEPAVPALAGLRQISVQPGVGTIDSCLDWFSVDLYLDAGGRLAAVTLDLYEP